MPITIIYIYIYIYNSIGYCYTHTVKDTVFCSSESVNEGHPDKNCDQVSDCVLDACLTADPVNTVACDTATTGNMVMLAGEITTRAGIDYEKVVDGLTSVDSKGLCDKTCEVLVRFNKQSPDIAGSVH